MSGTYHSLMVALGCIRKVTELENGTNPETSIPQWSLLHFGLRFLPLPYMMMLYYLEV